MISRGFNNCSSRSSSYCACAVNSPMTNTVTGKPNVSENTAHSLFQIPLELHSQKHMNLGVRPRDLPIHDQAPPFCERLALYITTAFLSETQNNLLEATSRSHLIQHLWVFLGILVCNSHLES